MAVFPNPVPILLDLVYPRLCPACEAPDREKAPVRLCADCSKRLRPLPTPFCDVCGEPVIAGSLTGATCMRCRQDRPVFDFARSAYVAEDLVRELVHTFKYGRQIYLSPLLADLLAHSLEDRRFSLETDWLMVPVPLHPARKRERHFNQAEELCRMLAKTRGLRMCCALRRKRYTPAQARLEREERLANLVGAFALSRLRWRRRAVCGANILLVDDVLTTGSTANECAKVLKRDGGASKVAVVTIARASTHFF